jgi:phosphinothricin acetyltransferase
VEIRSAQSIDVDGINEVGNYYIQHTPANFKLEVLNTQERLEWMKGFSETGRHQLLVGVEGETVLGYACSTEFHERCAYQTSVATTIYLRPEIRQQGLGSQLYSELFKRLKKEDLNRAFAGITLPNEGSVAIHKKFGFTEIGTFSQAGQKYGEYWDVLWMEKALQSQ